MPRFVAWVFETRPVEGWSAFEVEASTHASAVEKAREQLRGTRGAHTLQVDEQPIKARAA